MKVLLDVLVFFVVQPHTYTCRKIIKHNKRTSMNERTHVFIKNISLPLYFRKGWCWLWVRDELEMGINCYIELAVFLSHLAWVAQLLVSEDPKPSVCRWLSIRHLVSNWLEPPRAPGNIIVSRSPASAVLLLIYTGASLDWQLGRGSICYFFVMWDGWFWSS